jgi:hypothetical protein
MLIILLDINKVLAARSLGEAPVAAEGTPSGKNAAQGASAAKY